MTRMRSSPCTTIRRLPSVPRASWWMIPMVPMRCRSSGPGSSVASDRCSTRATNRFRRITSFTSLTEDGRPTVRGATASGKITVFRSGRTGRMSGIAGLSGAARWISSGMVLAPRTLAQPDAEQALLVAGLDPLAVHGDLQGHLHPEGALPNAHGMVDPARLAARDAAPPLDDQRILEQQNFHLVLVRSRQVNGDDHVRRRFVHVGVGPPARVRHDHAGPADPPEVRNRLRLAGRHYHRVPVTEMPIAHPHPLLDSPPCWKMTGARSDAPIVVP